MRQVIFSQDKDVIHYDSANHKKMVAICAGVVGVLVKAKDGWYIQWANDNVTPMFISLSALGNGITNDTKIFEL